MFRKARTHSLANKIQKYMKPRELNVDSKKIQESDELGESQVWAAYIDAFIKFLSNNLNENHMRTLLKSLESKGGITTECVIVPSQSEPAKKVGLDSLKSRSDVLVCKVLRWPDVESKSELKALISCQNYGGTLSCANPYHYSRIAKQDQQTWAQDTKRKNNTILQNQESSENEKAKRFSDDGFSDKDEDTNDKIETTSVYESHSISSPFSSHFTTQRSSDQTSDSTYQPWCSIAYWEIKRRVGRVFDVTNECVNVFYELPQGDGMCIGLLDHVERNDYIKNVRKHIGYGFQLTLEHDGIWIYNRSDYCIFVSAPLLTSETNAESAVGKSDTIRVPDVIRVSPGHCLQAVDFRSILSFNSARCNDPKPRYDVYCIRVSFAKGWGRNYTRQFITSCPCWTEIYLREPCLALMGFV